MRKLIIFYKLACEELDKVIFPTRAQVTSASVSVLVVVSVITLFLYLFDLLLGAFISSIL